MGQGADKTEMAVGVAAAMERLMKYRADREQHCQEEQHRQKTGQSRFCEGARSEVVSFGSHVFQVQSSTGNSQAQAGTKSAGNRPATPPWSRMAEARGRGRSSTTHLNQADRAPDFGTLSQALDKKGYPAHGIPNRNSTKIAD